MPVPMPHPPLSPPTLSSVPPVPPGLLSTRACPVLPSSASVGRSVGLPEYNPDPRPTSPPSYHHPYVRTTRRARRYEHRVWQLQGIRSTLGRLQNAEAYRALATWSEFAVERKRMMGLIQGSMHSLVMAQVKRGWRGWLDFIADVQEKQRIEQLRKRASARLKNPKLLAMYDHWHQEQRLAALARGDLNLGGLSPVARLCIALGMGKCAGVG